MGRNRKASRGVDGKRYRYPTSGVRPCAVRSTRPDVHRAEDAEFAMHAW